MTANDPAVKEVAQQVANSVQKLNDGLMAAEKDKALREKVEMQAAGRRVQAEKDKALRDARRVKQELVETERAGQEAQFAKLTLTREAELSQALNESLRTENKRLSERAVDADVFSAKKAIRALFNPDINHEVLTKPPATPENNSPTHTHRTRKMRSHERCKGIRG